MIGIGFVHFRTTTLDHLDAAWFTLARQDFRDVGHVVLLDNNTEDRPADIQQVLDRYPLPVPLVLSFQKHGDPKRTQSWSVNTVAGLVKADWLFFTRTDFLLSYDCLGEFARARMLGSEREGTSFVTSWCHQMGCDAALSNTDILAEHSQPNASWRRQRTGPASLVGETPANYFHETAIDAGVWLAQRELFTTVGPLNEKMVNWGYQQQDWQRRIAAAGRGITVLPRYGFHHQHHFAPRDPAVAMAEYTRSRTT